jgi:hypothetical protein
MTSRPSCAVRETPELLTDPTATPLPGHRYYRPVAVGALPSIRYSPRFIFRRLDWDKPNCRAICDGLTPTLKAARPTARYGRQAPPFLSCPDRATLPRSAENPPTLPEPT